MDLRDFGSTLARWWYLTLATLLLATLAAVGLYRTVGPTWTANSTVLLLPPKAVLIQAQADKTNYAPNNPLLYLGTLTDTRDVLVRNLSSNDVAERLKKAAPGASITVTGDLTSGSPLMLVKSEGSDQATALAGMRAVDNLVPSTLKSLQDQMNIASLQRISSIKITEDAQGETSNKKQIELAAVGFVGVTVVGLGLIALLDQLRNRRARREQGPNRAVAAPVATEPVATTTSTAAPATSTEHTVVTDTTEKSSGASAPAATKRKNTRGPRA